MDVPAHPVYRILLIDDDPSYVEPLERLLSQPPFQATACWSGESGLAEARKGGYHLIVLDMLMPGMHGMAALKELKSDPMTAGVPVFLSSSITDPKLKEEAVSAGAVGFIPKGTELHKIMSRIRRVLGI